jgi:hypothetical protein
MNTLRRVAGKNKTSFLPSAALQDKLKKASQRTKVAQHITRYPVKLENNNRQYFFRVPQFWIVGAHGK